MTMTRTTLGCDGYCEPCDKLVYFTRKRARTAAKRNHPHEHKQAYRCDQGPDRWHYGGLRQAVLYGHKTNSELRERRLNQAA